MTYQATVGLPYIFEAEVDIRVFEIFSLLHEAPNQALGNFEAQTISALDQIVLYLQAKRPARIALGLPLIIRKGKIMANFELPNDEIAWIAINTVDAAGAVVPAPSGDVFSAVPSDATKINAVIGTMPSGPLAGAVAVGINALVQLASALTVTITDTAKLTSFVLTVDIVADLTPSAISLDTTDAVFVPQPVPAA